MTPLRVARPANGVDPVAADPDRPANGVDRMAADRDGHGRVRNAARTVD